MMNNRAANDPIFGWENELLENRQDPKDHLKATLYFDGACPLCSREMARLKSCAGESTIDLVDIHTLGTQLNQELPDRESLLKTLHLRTENGEWLTGIDANIYAWRSTPYEKYWRLLTLPGIYWLSKKSYSLWAKIRYQTRLKK